VIKIQNPKSKKKKEQKNPTRKISKRESSSKLARLQQEKKNRTPVQSKGPQNAINTYREYHQHTRTPHSPLRMKKY
jgi:hypothetical protein